MAVPGPARGPSGAGVADDIFDFVERILDERFEIGAGIDVRALERITGVNRENGFGFQIFRPFEEFQKAHTSGGAIAPRAGMTVPLFDWAESFFPIEPGIDGVAFE